MARQAVTVLDVITEQQQILHLPLWSKLRGCGPETAVYSDQPIQQWPGESLITAFGRHAAGSNLDARRTNATLMTASKRQKRKRKTFAATTRTSHSFPISDEDSSDGPDRRRPPAPGGHDDDDDNKDDDDTKDDKDTKATDDTAEAKVSSNDRAPEGTDHHDGQAPSRSPEHPDLGQPGHLSPQTRDDKDQEHGNLRLPTPSGPAPPLAADPPDGAPPRPPNLRPPLPRPTPRRQPSRPPTSAEAELRYRKAQANPPAIPKQDECPAAPVRGSATPFPTDARHA